MAIKGFFEDWDGSTILGDIRNFKNEIEFLEKAELYIIETRGYRVSFLEPKISFILCNDEDWIFTNSKFRSQDDDFSGEKVTVYETTVSSNISKIDE